MGQWVYQQDSSNGGYFAVVFSSPGKAAKEVSFFRNTPIVISSYSSGDPFSDSVAVINFPQITGMDEIGVGSLDWLRGTPNVDIYYIEPDTAGSDLMSSLNQQYEYVYPDNWGLNPLNNVFQGFVASYELEQSDGSSSLSVQCQGALFQANRIISKPTYPSNPKLYEDIIADALSNDKHPSLRFQDIGTPVWPDGWDVLFPSGAATVFTPTGGKAGQKITGYWDRRDGNFRETLTGFVQGMLDNMYTQEDSGVRPGDNWTILMGPNRKPSLQVRKSDSEPLFDLHYGQIGATFSLSSDLTNAVNVVYGEGTGLDGVNWHGTDISNDGQTTSYIPIGYQDNVYPESTDSEVNETFDISRVLNETYLTGLELNFQQAQNLAQLKLSQFSDPGWTGTITISIDPNFNFGDYSSRWQIKAGFSVRVRNLFGSGPTGKIFHVAQVNANPMAGTVELTVDTNYRSLLTLDEVRSRTRDPLTPTKLLRIGNTSIAIKDQYAPWNVNVGSGFIPTDSTNFFADNNSLFPWKNQVAEYPPNLYPGYYVRVNANAKYSKDRWKTFPIILSESGSARLTQLAAYYEDGTPANVAFHFGIYDIRGGIMDPNYFPHTGTGKTGNYSPFRKYAFTKIDDNGTPWSTGTAALNKEYEPDPSAKVLWGNLDQKAGYWPGQSSLGSPATGLLVDEGSWDWSFNQNDKDVKRVAGQNPATTVPTTAYSYTAAIYCEANEDVFFIGRIFRKEPGA